MNENEGRGEEGGGEREIIIQFGKDPTSNERNRNTVATTNIQARPPLSLSCQPPLPFILGTSIPIQEMDRGAYTWNTELCFKTSLHRIDLAKNIGDGWTRLCLGKEHRRWVDELILGWTERCFSIDSYKHFPS